MMPMAMWMSCDFTFRPGRAASPGPRKLVQGVQSLQQETNKSMRSMYMDVHGMILYDPRMCISVHMYIYIYIYMYTNVDVCVIYD